jgi:hypothetical protein
MNLNPDHLHHAYILFGNINESAKQLREFFDTSITNIQWLEYRYEKLGIDEVRELRRVVSQKTDGRFLVIITERFPVEAQQALLKILEEPADNTHLFIIVPSQVFVLETILSRAITIRSEITTTDQLLPIRQFLLGTVKSRLDDIEVLVKSREKDESLQSYEVQQFLDQIESALYALFSKKRSIQFTESFQAIRDARGWAGQTGFPMKNIIEYVAMVLPEFGRK